MPQVVHRHAACLWQPLLQSTKRPGAEPERNQGETCDTATRDEQGPHGARQDAADEDLNDSPEGSDGLLDDADTSGLTIWIVFVAVFAATAVPVIEELVYRGLWWSALLKRGMSEWWVLLITSAAFAAAHFEPSRFPVLFTLGIALGMGRLLTGRIGASIITHALINGLGMVALLTTV